MALPIAASGHPGSRRRDGGLKRKLSTVSAVALAMFGIALPAYAVIVSGIFDPWLAGLPAGSRASFGDVAPTHSPVLVPSLSLLAGQALTFGVSGSVNNVNQPSGLTPDGGGFVSHTGGDENGIAGLTAPNNSLTGILLDSAQPDGSAAPSALNFSQLGTDFTSISPLLKQPFFIGDGLAGTGTGSVQSFIVPAGATRLFLGTMDQFGWFDNFGSFDVTVNGTTTPPPGPGPAPVPEPATITLLLGGLAAARFLRRRDRSLGS